MTTLPKKVALVTGGATGIGRAIANRLAQDGIAVAINYLSNPAQAEAVVSEIKKAGGVAKAFRANVGVVAEIVGLFDDVRKEYGGIDVAVASAGIPFTGVAIADVSEEDFDRVSAVNYKGTYFVLQQAAKHVRDGGRIIQISSSSTVYPAAGLGLYAPSKAAGRVIIDILSQELGARQISVNSVLPGGTKTAFMEAATEEELARIAQGSSLGRMGEPQDIAEVVAFLARPEGAWINGQQIVANGGGRV